MENLQPPKTIEEMGIHLVYMSKAIQELNMKLDSYSSNFVPNNIFLVYQENTSERLKSFEERLSNAERNDNDFHDFISKWTGKVWGINSTIAVIAGFIAFLANLLAQKYFH